MWNVHKISKRLIFLILCLSSLILSSEQSAAVSKKKVCIIGAGAAGLVSAQQLAEYPNEFDPVIFEKDNYIGGVWRYTDSIDVDENNMPVHSSMYAYLRTNLPKELMAFPNYRNFSGDRSCVTHKTVLSYLQNFTDYYNLKPYIKLNHLIEKVTYIPGNGDWQTDKWQITVRKIRPSNNTFETTCDAIMVCNGHYFEPRMPRIKGIETFPGRVIHSHIYRKPEDFSNQTVLILGASSSGIDISIEVSEFAKVVYLSHNKPKIEHRLPSNIIQVSGAISANGSTLTLKDGTTVKADSMIFCTGFLFTYPFLDESTAIKVEDNQVSPVYKHLINIEHPSMAVVGLPLLVVHFPLFHVQAHYFVSLLQGNVKLPSKAEMLKDSELKGKPKRYAHILGNAQWDYNDELAHAGGFEPLPAYYRKGYEIWDAYRTVNILDFKKSNLLIKENGDVELVHPKSTEDIKHQTL